MEKKVNKLIKSDKKPLLLHKQVIDEYFNNGFNMVKAVMSASPGVSYQGASSLGKLIIASPVNKAYIQDKQNEIKASVNVDTAQIVREWLNLSFSDATDYLELTSKQLKELPPDARRAIASIRTKKKKYKGRDGVEVVEETHEIKLVDKVQALNALSKYVGLYEQDNKQKASSVNLTNINTDQLNVLLQVATKALKP